jgi:hypothetical protein
MSAGAGGFFPLREEARRVIEPFRRVVARGTLVSA